MRIATIFLIAAMAAGCGGPLLGVSVFVVGERTSLENQVLGTYRDLNVDFEGFASVRGVDETGRIRRPPAMTDSKQAVIAAMRNRAYNRDDVEEFLAQGVVGERIDGMLELFEEKLGALPEARREFLRAVVKEENRDRGAILARLMATTPGVAPGDEAEVRGILARLNRDAAPEGARVQREDGSWVEK